MKVIGLTGGIGAGKTTAANWFKSQGAQVIDTDIVARDVVEPGQPALAGLVTRFGNQILDHQGRLRRDQLAEIVFSDPAARKDLEAILHPRIRSAWEGKVAQLRSSGCELVVVVIPLLFETSAPGFDATICIACSYRTQEKRLLDRGWTPAQILQRNSAQMPMDKKMGLADYVVWSEGLIPVMEQQLARLMSSLRG